MTRLSSEILSPPPIFEKLSENDAEYSKCQPHSVIGVYSNLVEKFNPRMSIAFLLNASTGFDDITGLQCNHCTGVKS